MTRWSCSTPPSESEQKRSAPPRASSVGTEDWSRVPKLDQRSARQRIHVPPRHLAKSLFSALVMIALRVCVTDLRQHGRDHDRFMNRLSVRISPVAGVTGKLIAQFLTQGRLLFGRHLATAA